MTTLIEPKYAVKLNCVCCGKRKKGVLYNPTVSICIDCMKSQVALLENILPAHGVPVRTIKDLEA